MSDDKNLYFLPLIFNAFESDNPFEAIKVALMKIVELGKMEEYQKGYEQFKQFLEIGINNEDISSSNFIDNLLVSLKSDNLLLDKSFREELLAKAKLNPILLNKYLQISNDNFSSIPLEIQIYKDETLVVKQSVSNFENEFTITKINSGNYSIRLSNGRTLWQGEIKNDDIKIDFSISREKYKLAAETEDSNAIPTQTIDILKGGFTLNIYPGLELGRIKIVKNG